MRLGIFAKTFKGDLEDALDRARASGFEAVQFNMACAGLPSMPDAIPRGLVERIRRAVEARGLEICAVSGTFNMVHPDPARREAGLRQIGVIAGACRAMGSGVITLCTGTRDPEDMWRHHPDNASPEAWRDLRASMQRALEIAEAHRVTLAIEPEVSNVVSGAIEARRLLDEMNSSHLRVVIDAANLYRHGDLPDRAGILERAFALLGEALVMAHAKDVTLEGEFVAAGKGAVDFEKYLGLLRAANFTGPLVAHGLSEYEAEGVAQFLRSKILAERNV